MLALSGCYQAGEVVHFQRAPVRLERYALLVQGRVELRCHGEGHGFV